MNLHPADFGIDCAALARALTAAPGTGKHQYINELLCDVRAWRKLRPEELAERLAADPLAVVAALELTSAAKHIESAAPSDGDFLKLFRRYDFLAHLAYLGLPVVPEPLPTVPRTALWPRHSPWDTLVFLQLAVRWAQRFAYCPPGDAAALRRTNLQHPFLAAVLAAPQTPEEALLQAVLCELGIRTIDAPTGIAGHRLGMWLAEQLGVSAALARGKQQKLDFRQAGGTRNSLFVVRAMGGVDGCDVRGVIGEDLGLIIDIGDREINAAVTAYLEEQVVEIINNHTELAVEPQNGSLVLRWYDTRLSAEDLGQIVYRALKEQFILSIISVNLLFDAIRISTLRPSVLAYREDRSKELKRRQEEHEPFVLCRSCASYAPQAFCVVSVDRPPCCHRSFDELAVLARYTRSVEQVTLDRGVCQDRLRGHYIGADKLAHLVSAGHVARINLHSLRDHPHPCTALAECMLWFLEELDVIAAMSADYTGRAPDGKTFDTLLARAAGRQQPGLIGVNEAYLASPRFLASEGGIARMGWMNATLKARLGLRAEHIATEADCINLAGLKEFLATWRH